MEELRKSQETMKQMASSIKEIHEKDHDVLETYAISLSLHKATILEFQDFIKKERESVCACVCVCLVFLACVESEIERHIPRYTQ